MSDKENNPDASSSLIKVEADHTQIDNMLIENPSGTAVEVEEASEVAIRESEFRNTQTAVRSQDSSLIIYRSTITNSVIGFDAQEGTDATVVDVEFSDNEIADIVYYDDVSIEFMDVVAKRVLEITQPQGLRPAEIELSRKAHKVISTRRESDKREAFFDLSISARDIAQKVAVSSAANYLIRVLEQLWKIL